MDRSFEFNLIKFGIGIGKRQRNGIRNNTFIFYLNVIKLSGWIPSPHPHPHPYPSPPPPPQPIPHSLPVLFEPSIIFQTGVNDHIATDPPCRPHDNQERFSRICSPGLVPTRPRSLGANEPWRRGRVILDINGGN